MKLSRYGLPVTGSGSGAAQPVWSMSLALFAIGIVLSLVGSAAAASTPVPLATTDSFAVLAGAGITNTGPTTLNGDIGTFPTTSVSGAGSLTITGTNHGGDAVTQQAKSDLVTAYNIAAGEGPTIPVSADLAGQTLTPGVYNSASALGLTGNLTLNAGGDPNAVFVFQAGSTLTTASASSITLENAAQACNVFWQVGSSATLGTGSSFRGTIIALTSITLTTGATVEGRVLARNGAVTLDTNTITKPACTTGTTTTTTETTTETTTTTVAPPAATTQTTTVATPAVPTQPTPAQLVAAKVAAAKTATATKLAAEKLAAENLAATNLAAENLAATKLAATKLAATKPRRQEARSQEARSQEARSQKARSHEPRSQEARSREPGSQEARSQRRREEVGREGAGRQGASGEEGIAHAPSEAACSRLRNHGLAVNEAITSGWRGPLAIACSLLALGATSATSSAATPTGATSRSQQLVTLLASHRVHVQSSSRAAAFAVLPALTPITEAKTTLPVLDSRGGWLLVRLPGRPNGRAGWIQATKTSRSVTYWHIFVSTDTRTVTVDWGGRAVKVFKAVVGKPSTPSPGGQFFVEEPVALGSTESGGPFALALSARSNVLQEFDGGPGQIAIHGLENVGGVPGTAVSHGCIRVANENARWLAARIGAGVPVTISR